MPAFSNIIYIYITYLNIYVSNVEESYNYISCFAPSKKDHKRCTISWWKLDPKELPKNLPPPIFRCNLYWSVTSGHGFPLQAAVQWFEASWWRRWSARPSTTLPTLLWMKQLWGAHFSFIRHIFCCQTKSSNENLGSSEWCTSLPTCRQMKTPPED